MFLVSLRDSYSTIFQPDPHIPEYHSLLLGLISDKIGESNSLAHTPISNLPATYHALNASQLVGLRYKAKHVAVESSGRNFPLWPQPHLSGLACQACHCQATPGESLLQCHMRSFPKLLCQHSSLSPLSSSLLSLPPMPSS